MKLLEMSKSNSKESSPGQETGGGMSLSSSSFSGGVSTSLLRIHMEDEFTILKLLAEGTFSKVYLAKRSSSEGSSSYTERLVLKAIHSELSSVEEFTRELQLTYFLSPHPNIVTCYNVSFMWNNCFVFVQEHAPFGSLSRFIKKGNGLPESQVKLVSQQVVSALEFMHQMNLVHRDVTPHNVLVFKSSMSLVKLCDFGCTRAQGSLVVRTDSSSTTTTTATYSSSGSSHALMAGHLILSSFAPPEISDLLPQEKYHCAMSSDVWQVGILIFTCLTGSPPWTCADITDSGYRHYESWLRRKSLKIPEPLKPFSPRFVRLFKRLLEPKASQRSEVREVFKYLKDDWYRRKRPVTTGSSHFSLERHDGIKGGAGGASKTQKRHSQDDTITHNANTTGRHHLCLEEDKSGNHRLSIRSNHGMRSGQSNTSKQASYCGGGGHQEDEGHCRNQHHHHQQKGSHLLLKEFGIQTEIDKKRVEDWIVSTADQPTVLKDHLLL